MPFLVRAFQGAGRFIGALLFILLPGCADLETSFNVLTFQKADRSGIVRGQHFLAFVMSGDGGVNAAVELPPLLTQQSDPKLTSRLNICRQPRPKFLPRQKFLRYGLSGAAIAAVISKAGTLVYDAVFNEIEAKRARLQAASQVSHEARLSWSSRFKGWDDITCVVLTRLTDLDLNGQPDELGFVAILWRDSLSSGASQFKPIYLRLNNASAITGSSDEPGLQIDIVMTVKSYADKQIQQHAAIKLPPIQARLGAETPVCAPTAEENLRPIDCPLATEMFANPPAKAEALQITISVTESGSGVPDKERVEAGNKALKELTKPIFDDILEQLADAAKKRGS